MALSDENGNMVMPVAPMYGGGGFGGNSGHGFGSDGWWIILLFILLGNKGCCFNVAVRYVDATTDDPATVPTPVIEVQNANLTITRIA